MNLTDAISESLLEDSYFGLPKEPLTFKALRRQICEDITGIKHIDVTVLAMGADGIAKPHSFTVDEIMNVDWIVKETAGEINNDLPLHHGIVEVAVINLELTTELLEKKGYGRVDSYDLNQATDTATLFCRSHLFSKVESGSPTPKYTLTYEEDTGTLTANRI